MAVPDKLVQSRYGFAFVSVGEWKCGAELYLCLAWIFWGLFLVMAREWK
jgi:hypothetical protein